MEVLPLLVLQDLYGWLQKVKTKKEKKRVLSIAKTNFSAGDGGFAYLIEEVELSNHPDILTTRVNWNGTLDGKHLILFNLWSE